MSTPEFITTFNQTQDKKAFRSAIKAHFQTSKLHKSIEPYLFGEVDTKGLFNIYPFEKAIDNRFTFEKLFGDHGTSIFPAVLIGGDRYGVEFWLELGSGRVISLHHDASFFEVAGGIEADDPADFVKQFVKEGSAFSLTALLQFQQFSRSLETDDADFELKLIRMTAEALGWSISRLSTQIEELPLEPIYTLAREFIDDSGFKDLIRAEKQIKKFEKENKEVADLSFCFLPEIPAIIAEKDQLRQLNLSGNPLRIQNELEGLSLTKLELGECGLDSLPPLPASLEYLDLSSNNLSDLSPLKSYKKLKFLGIKDLPVGQDQVDAFKSTHPDCFVLQRDRSYDFESKKLDLSNQNLKKLPEEIAKFNHLEALDLSTNPKLDFSATFRELARLAPGLKSIKLEECGLSALPEELFLLENLEEIDFQDAWDTPQKRKNQLEIEENMSILHRLPKLKKLPWNQVPKGDKLENYLEQLAHYKSLQEITFVDRLENGTLGKIFEVIQHLPVETLNLKDFLLQAPFPKNAKDLIHLKTLNWHRQSYTREVPDFIFEFPGLETLSITDTQFKKLPAKIAQLTTLKKLAFLGKAGYIIHCEISPEVGNLTSLESLSIGDFYLEHLPESLGELTKLKKLDIRDCKLLKKIPEWITSLENLEELYLQNNVFEHLPESIGNLTKLRVLDLNECQFTSLPESLGQLVDLRILNMRNLDGLTALPDSFGKLTQLEELDLSGKQLSYPEALKKVAQLKNLKKFKMIELNNREEFYVPEEFSQLSNLKEILLYHSAGMKTVDQAFEVLSQLDNLEVLDMDFYQWAFEKNIPDSLANFKGLKSIHISLGKVSKANISRFFERLSHIPTLKKINAHQGLGYLPAEIGLLKNLEELQLSWNGLETYPAELLDLKHLQLLILSASGLSKSQIQEIKKGLPYTEVWG